MPFEKVEFDFPDPDKEEDLEIEGSSAETIDTSGKKKVEEPSDDFDIEVVDDTPPEDRGRTPSEPPEDVTEEELEAYSEKVRKRIQHFTKGYHDERRAKEQAMREREELERLAQKLVDENSKLKGTVSKNQAVLIEQAKKQVAVELEQAKRAYKDAYESGNADALLEAQDKLTSARLRSERVENFKVPALQEEQNEVQTQEENTTAPVTVKPDDKAVQWADANPWFGTDDEMTSFALGLHKKLVTNGVDPQSDEYYQSINARMRHVFPENFEDAQTQEVDKPKRNQNVVAPATRSTAPRKVKLTQTQVAIAKRLGVPLEQYAKQVADLMRNG
jgi:hypothetical protein